MTSATIIGISFAYLALLFAIASWAEKRARQQKSVVNNPLVYSLSLAVYCTAWTYYGSIGRAASQGLDYILIYIGPTLIAPVCWVLLRKVIRICKLQHITTLADFLSARYGKSLLLGGVVSVICVLGIIPYIALQIKALNYSIALMTNGPTAAPTEGGLAVLNDATLYLTLALGAFAILYGTRTLEADERNEGMVAAIAFESVWKLGAFLLAGIYICFGLFDGPADIFSRAFADPAQRSLLVLNEAYGYTEWFWMTVLSLLAFLLLPRQFQLAVVENYNEKHLNKAAWMFPLYLLLINVLVLPIALAGNLYFAGQQIDADTYLLAFPLSNAQPMLAVIAYLGGFSAATSMIIVSTIALSRMVSNNLLMPVFAGSSRLQNRYFGRYGSILLFTRWAGTLLILSLAYLYFRMVGGYYSLVSIGLISFAAVAQLAPATFGALFWKQGNRYGALAGMTAGFLIWGWTLVIPSLVSAGWLPQHLMAEGPFGWELFRPFALMGLSGMDYISHAMFWSLSVNCLLYVSVSLFTKQSSIGHNQSELFVDIFRYSTVYESTVVWKGTAYVRDIRSLLVNLLGQKRVERSLDAFCRKHGLSPGAEGLADPRMVQFAERMLAGAVGTASARIMVASVTKEEEITVDEVVEILRESQRLVHFNRELQRKSQELKRATEQLSQANEKLKRQDELKDEFIHTLTHELRTPLTSIRALSEILFDNEDVELEERQHFLGTIVRETERLTRLIEQVLDVEKLESGRETIQPVRTDLARLVSQTTEAVSQYMAVHQAELSLELPEALPPVLADPDRISQVLINLMGNAAKFSRNPGGKVHLSTLVHPDYLLVQVADNGEGIPEGMTDRIFDKFFQGSTDLSGKKRSGSGLGLTISRKLVELHGGRLWAENIKNAEGAVCGASFSFTLPLWQQPATPVQNKSHLKMPLS